ncbi:MAG TPA: chemotaxis protein CheB, partial [Pirellulales bacterium]|nr:chemotaxis protein CheB [Pirellulales bacterium]
MPNKQRRSGSDPRPGVSQLSADDELVVVGVGASAGGLGAFERLLRGLPEQPGFAIVLVQHLSPQHESALPSLLSPATPLPVVAIADGMALEANRVYVVPPNAQLRVVGRRLRLEPRPADLSQYTPIDYFFRWLAEDVQNRAVGVILSGSAHDGALGMREIKAVGGVTIVQSPETAEFDGMPRAAIAAEAVDLVLPPEEIGSELARLVRHAGLLRPDQKDDQTAAVSDAQWQRLFVLLNQSTSVDFATYKLPTIQRRLRRRMALRKTGSIDAYLECLERDPAEVKRLFQDLLIQATRFFREPESFEALGRLVSEELLPGRGAGEPLRIWIPGCATGEDAYSAAIVLLETLRECGAHVPVQIFGTDLSEAAIDRARSGVYPPSIAGDVGEWRLERFFNRTDGSYRVNRQVRDTCIFARQDVTRDPPYTRLDLILCRNLLIYLGAAMQNKLVHVFHYALRPNGFLILGPAETVDPSTDLFRVVDNKQRVYRKNPADASLPLQLSAPHYAFGARSVPQASEHPRANHAQAEANRLLLERYAPPGVIVDAKLQIIEFRGQTHPYLTPAPGAASFNLLKMVQEGLSQAVRSAVHEAQQNHVTVRKEGLHVRVDSQLLVTNLVVL